MASIKLKFSPSSRPNGKGRLFFQLIHKRKVRQIATGFYIFNNEWDRSAGSVISSGADIPTQRLVSLRLLAQKAACLKARLEMALAQMLALDPGLSASQLSSRLGELRSGAMSVFEAFDGHIACLEAQGRFNTAAHFRTALNSLRSFLRGLDLCFEQVDGSLCLGWERHLRAGGVCRNTSSAYMRCLRSLYNKAVKCGMASGHSPFDGVFTGNARTQKRALCLDEVRRIRQLDLGSQPALEFARDMFLFSIFCRGMSLVDMSRLSQKNIKSLRLSYVRQKTGRELAMQWVAQMQQIVDRWHHHGSDLLLPLAVSVNVPAKRPAHKSVGQWLNRSLAKIASLASLARPFTMYAARHTWATLARDNGTSLFVIKEALGHSSLQTTQIYLADLDSSLVDVANGKVINSLLF